MDLKINFGSNVDAGSIAIRIDSSAVIMQHAEEIIASFNRLGLALLEFRADESAEEQLLALRGIFGDIKNHDRSNQAGIAEIKVSDKFPGYLGTSNEAHPFHTDGSYENNPPAVFALRCGEPAKEGGLTQVVSGKALHDWLARKDSAALAALYQPSALLVERAGKSATKAVFLLKDGRVRMSFRSDATAQFAKDPDTQRAVSLIVSFLQDRNNVLEFKMRKGQIIVIDNGAILHGRTAFPANDPREMQRLFFSGSSGANQKLVLGFSA